MRSVQSVAITLLLFGAAGCNRAQIGPVAGIATNGETSPAITAHDLSVRLFAFANDSMMGREAGSYWGEKAADYVAAEFQRLGVQAAGENGGYFQVVPNIKPRDTTTRRGLAKNVIGIIPGSDPALRTEYISITAHNDHIGFKHDVVDHDSLRAYNEVIRPLGADSRPHAPLPAEAARIRAILDSLRKVHPPRPDSIYNGADDDGSGTVAVLEIARIMKPWPTPGRTVVFLATTGEEAGLVGTRWYLANPVRPLSSMAANLEIEMIGRPDTLATGRGRGWLTGFERSSMGESFQNAGLPIMADMRPSQSFFTRSDNIAFAQAGIPAHTLSSYNMHTDYHSVTDDVSRIDFAHMATLINTGARAVWILTDGPAPIWNRGGRPCPAMPRGPRPQLSPAAQDSARLAAELPHDCPR
jgi:hypothetical protein